MHIVLFFLLLFFTHANLYSSDAQSDTPVEINNLSYFASLIADYKTAYGEATYNALDPEAPEVLGETLGVLYTRFIDFNKDGIDELVIVRINKETKDFTNSMQIYGLVNNSLTKIGTFTPFFTKGDRNIYFAEYVDVGEEIYLATGQEGANTTYWRLAHTRFIKAQSFTIENNESGLTVYYVNGNKTNQENYQRNLGQSHKEQLSYLNKTNFNSLIENNQLSLMKVENLPLADGQTPAATFNGSQFVIFEKTPFFDEEKVIQNYFNALTTNNAETLAELDASFNLANWQKNLKTKQYIPAYVIEDISVIIDDPAIISLNLASEVALASENLEETRLIGALIKEVPSLSKYKPKTGYGTFPYWFLLTKTGPDQNWQIHKIFTNKLYDKMGPDNAFSVRYMGASTQNESELLSGLAAYLTDEEIKKTIRLKLAGKEHYLIKSKFKDAKLKVYEFTNRETEPLGKLIYETKSGENLLVTCNLNETDSKIIIETRDAKNQLTYTYVPATISGQNIANLGFYGEEFLQRIATSVKGRQPEIELLACGVYKGFFYEEGAFIILADQRAFALANGKEPVELKGKVGKDVCLVYKENISHSESGKELSTLEFIKTHSAN